MANEIRDAFNAAYADGPVGSPTQPPKAEVRVIGGLIQDTVDALRADVDNLGGVPAQIEALDVRMDAAEVELADHETRLDNAESLLASGTKAPVAVSALSTVNIAVATGVVNGATIGGYVVSTGQTVVLAGQTAPAENGAYIVAAAGAASRSTLFDTSDELLGAAFAVTDGTQAGATWAVRNTSAITVGTTAITITHAYGSPGNATQTEVTAARQGEANLAANLTAMKATVSAFTEVQAGATPANAGVATLFLLGDAVVGYVSLADGEVVWLNQGDAEDDVAAAAYADSSRYQVSANEMWSQWVWPRTVEDEYGTAYWGSVGKQEGERAGPLFIGRRKAYGGAGEKTVIGLSEENTGPWEERGWIDDHDRPCSVINPRPGAVYPLTAQQADHGSHAWMRYWRSTTKNPDDLAFVSTIVNGAQPKTYGQYYLHPDGLGRMFGMYRDGGSSTPYWSFLYRAAEADLPAAWTHYADRFDGAGLYVVMIPRLDQLGVWLVFYGHPGNSPDPTIKLAKLNWDWSLTALDGTVIRADLRTGANINPHDETEGVDFTTIAVPAGADRFRLFDAREYDDDTLRILYADFPTTGNATTTGNYKMATVNLATNAVTLETVCPCGGKIEEETANYSGQFVQTSNGSSYIAGACLTDRPSEIVAARWWKEYGDLVWAVDNGTTWDLTTIDYSTGGKIARPEGHVRNWWDPSNSTIREDMTSRVSYWRGAGPDGGYSMFYDFNANRVTVDLLDWRSIWK